MLPFYDEERKRRINLGGTSRSTTSSSILDQVRIQRLQREEQKKQQDAALSIQAWWRGHREWRRVKTELRGAWELDPFGITGLRCLVLLGNDEETLGRWSERMGQVGMEQIFALAKTEHAGSWLVLVRKAALRLLQSVSISPLSPHAENHLNLLTTLLSTKIAARHLDSSGDEAVRQTLGYLLQHDYYTHLGEAIKRIPLEVKKSPALSSLVSLTSVPLTTWPSGSPEHAYALSRFLARILSIPLLPNRISIQDLPLFLSRIPLANLHALAPHTRYIVDNTSIEEKIHLVSNTSMFFTPHYAKFTNESMGWYLRFMASVFNELPVSAFDASKQKTNATGDKKKKGGETAWTQTPYDSDSDDERGGVIKVQVVSSFTTPPPPTSVPPLDTKTLTRLQKLPSQSHIEALLNLARRSQKVQDAFILYVLALNAVWPEHRERVLTSILALTEGNLIKTLYKGDVRSSPLGKEERSAALFDPKNADRWPPLLFLAELYAQALVTMGDDEFFSSSPSSSYTTTSSSLSSSSLSSSSHHHSLSSGPSSLASSSSTTTTTAVRNPLTLDELIAFTRQLLNIAFTLFWTDDQSSMQVGSVGGLGGRYTWEVVRERVTRCLVSVHARDSRKPFIPPDGWLVTSNLDMKTFVEAAILEETQLSDPDSASSIALTQPSSSSRTSRTSRNRNLTKRSIALLSPCLGVLNNIPFSIPFEIRVSIFRHFVLNDMMKVSGGAMDRFGGGWGWHDKTRIRVRRGRVAQDGFDRLSEVDLKKPVEITFVDQWGQEEAGIDGGGVFKEFFTDLCKEVFDTDRGLWLANKKNELYPNPHSYATEQHSLNWYRFIGRVLGKAMYEGILVDVAFASFFLARVPWDLVGRRVSVLRRRLILPPSIASFCFLRFDANALSLHQWLGKQSFLDDLASLDPELYKGLIFLKHYKGNPEDLALNFTIAVDELGVTKDVELVPGGSNITVTKANRLDYITLVSHYRLKKQIKKQSDAFFDGLSDMIDPRWLRMFNQQEVQILIGGVNSPIDLDDLRQHTNYGGLYDDRHPVIVAFWKVVNSFDQEQRRALLRFVTSCSRPPLLGFKELVPHFSIRDAGTDELRLPTSTFVRHFLMFDASFRISHSHRALSSPPALTRCSIVDRTCPILSLSPSVWVIQLPMYPNERIMKEKILHSIMSNSGFDLS
ncbi:ubiquitin protein ligase [Coprinopsis cinerea okayama7|uniref:HECT-type E3 ubiquitin transferase n=1 Tax=Coprinopsis cinerea (strain Okayama-7 / 130 / ATCC MYA-4618 / FGSC 9003) TaxID=240176 RepID=A8PAX4_COPC7|nr:ubiquitin protein ligase [Coprinopsis cinerea okayama7\|eukprot:XP_001840065.2 ubiquitin protein ligase [Coprinopsis cinerea okayama7\